MRMLYIHDRYRGFRRLLLTIVGILTVIPLAPVINRYIPPLLVGNFNFDLAVSILLAAMATIIVLRLFHYLLMPALILFAAVIIYNHFTNDYGFGSMINDYRSMVKNNWGRKEQKETNLVMTPSFFDGPLTKTTKSLQSKVDFKDSVVRNFAVQHSLDYFDEYHNKYGPLVRVLSLFKYINTNFKYVSDSQRDEYFAGPRETILNGLGGDCDDHTILMISALKAIGAECRMVLTEGHLYPELHCGDERNFEKIQNAIIHLFGRDVKGNIYYHEQNGKYWINLDYSAHYPGGPYMSEKAYAIVEF